MHGGSAVHGHLAVCIGWRASTRLRIRTCPPGVGLHRRCSAFTLLSDSLFECATVPGYYWACDSESQTAGDVQLKHSSDGSSLGSGWKVSSDTEALSMLMSGQLANGMPR
jgi:hypothetical protein